MNPTIPARREEPDPKDFLISTRIIDHHHPAVREKARELAAGLANEAAIAERCFLFVRDGIRHSGDFCLNPVTLCASEVLEHRTGFCYAKSHLLAALLRANDIPAALCYQRLAYREYGRSFCLHGLNAVYLQEYGWYRIDPRGNNAGIDSRFSPPGECLAYVPHEPGEADLPGIFAEPVPEVIDVLTRCRDYEDVLRNLPDRTVTSGNFP
jgi:transglutaminase-like putative cysteine protease